MASNLRTYVGQVQRKAPSLRAQLKAIFAFSSPAKRLFIAADGTLKPDAETLFDRMAMRARLGTHGFSSDAAQMAYLEGRRDMALFVMGMAVPDEARVERISEMIRNSPPEADEGNHYE